MDESADESTTDVPSLQYILPLCMTHEYCTYTESDAEIIRNIALTLVMIIVRISLK